MNMAWRIQKRENVLSCVFKFKVVNMNSQEYVKYTSAII